MRITARSTSSNSTTEHSFTQSPVRIGRNHGNDLQLAHGSVSGWHAIIRFDESAACYFDLGSTNGTFCQGRVLQRGEPVHIDPAATVELGEVELRLTFGAHPRALATAPQEAPHVSAARRASVRRPKAIEDLLHTLAALDDERRRAEASFDQALVDGLAALPGPIRAQGNRAAQRAFARPTLDTGPQQHVQLAAPSLHGFLGDLLPPSAIPQTPAEQHAVLSRIREVLLLCANGVIELRRSQERFGREVGVRGIREYTPLHVADSAEELLELLLSGRESAELRSAELARMFSDFVLHQVSLVHGVGAGARALLTQLHPDRIAPTRRSWRPFGGGRFRAFVRRYRALLDDEKARTEALFGPEFARAYASVDGTHPVASAERKPR